MVYFNDPLPCADPAGEAIRMADAFREEMKAWCAEWRSRGYNLGLGMGISLGQATIGEIGFEGRHDYGVIGRSVNLAARLCAEAADGEILVDEQAYEGARGIAKMQFIGHLSLKGFQAPAPVYNVLSTAEAAPGGESSADSATE
jgi:class 3 adenylate cyclase